MGGHYFVPFEELDLKGKCERLREMRHLLAYALERRGENRATMMLRDRINRLSQDDKLIGIEV